MPECEGAYEYTALWDICKQATQHAVLTRLDIGRFGKGGEAERAVRSISTRLTPASDLAAEIARRSHPDLKYRRIQLVSVQYESTEDIFGQDAKLLRSS